MGNRAVIEHLDYKGNPDGGIYLHWNGGRDKIEAFLEYAKIQGIDRTNDDYQIARLAQIIGNYIDGNSSLGILSAENISSPGDNGIYVVNNELNIIERKDFDSLDQNEINLSDMLKDIDTCQPRHMQLGDNFIESYLENKEKQFSIADIEIGDTVAIPNHIRGGWNIVEIIGFGEEGARGNLYDLSNKPMFNLSTIFPKEAPNERISDSEAMEKYKNNSNAYIKDDDKFIVMQKNKKSSLNVDIGRGRKRVESVRPNDVGKGNIENPDVNKKQDVR